jgi:hypothetical protein
MHDLCELDIEAGEQEGVNAKFSIPLVEGLRVAIDELARSDPVAFATMVASVGPGHRIIP